ncbi:hypothetical protein C8R44DRAFT_869856 [Mycena epipterygia]|nr:hypothetical protein C8R44DRAFT_869856 [Mycena epipterygia]
MAIVALRHWHLYFLDGTLTLEVHDGSGYYNVYLILKSNFFNGMLTLPIADAAPPSFPPPELKELARVSEELGP